MLCIAVPAVACISADFVLPADVMSWGACTRTALAQPSTLNRRHQQHEYLAKPMALLTMYPKGRPNSS